MSIPSARIDLLGRMPAVVLTGLRALHPAAVVPRARPEDVGPDASLVVCAGPAASVLDLLARCPVPPRRVLLVSEEPAPRAALRALAAGAAGWVVPTHDRPDAVELALRRAVRGSSFVSPVVLSTLVRHLRTNPVPTAPTPAFSAEERQIMRLLTSGMTNERMGRLLSLSEGSVRNRVTRIYAKLGVRRRPQAVAAWSRLLRARRPDGR